MTYLNSTSIIECLSKVLILCLQLHPSNIKNDKLVNTLYSLYLFKISWMAIVMVSVRVLGEEIYRKLESKRVKHKKLDVFLDRKKG